MSEVNTPPTSRDSANGIKEFLKRWPRIYYTAVYVVSPAYFGGLGVQAFLRTYTREGKCVNVGSGARRLAPGIINVDATKYDAVDIVANAEDLPFEDASIARVICDQVLEHTKHPERVVSEIHRVLAPGGYAYISTPFLYPFHASPSDYHRWTYAGLQELLKDFTVREGGVRCGPFSTLTVYLCYLIGSLFSFGSERLYWFLVYSSTLIFFPIKFLDIIGNRLPFAINMASVPYVVVEKK